MFINTLFTKNVNFSFSFAISALTNKPRKTLTALCAISALIPAYAANVVVPPSEQMVLREIQQQVSASRLKSDVTELVGFGTRHTLSETESTTQGIGAARRWIKSEFDKISAQCGGCLEVIYQKQTFSGEKRIPNPTEVVNCLLYTSDAADE